MIRKFAWSALYLYVFGFLSYGIFGLQIQKGVTLEGFMTEHKTRHMPWDKKKPTKEVISPIRSDEPKIEISFEMLDNVG